MTRRWKYEPRGPRKPKHGWSKDRPGFVEGKGDQVIGKCPSNLTIKEAEELLNTGIEWTNPSSHHKEEWPEQIYVVHQGTVYRAIPTRRGVSYHGFPAQRDISRYRRLKDEIIERARELDCEKEVKRWMRKYMGMKQL